MRAGRRIVAAVVVGAWLWMVGAQVRREYLQPELTRIARAALALGPGTHFYTLRMGARAVGQATSALDTVPGGFRLEDRMVLELPALGQTGRAVARTEVLLDSVLHMERFSFSLDSEAGRFQADGTVDGDTLLEVRIRSQGSEQTLRFRLAAPPVFSAMVPIRVAMGGALKVGSSVRLPVFDPSTLSTRSVEVRVLEHDTLAVPDSAALDGAGRWVAARWDSVPAWRIAEVFGGVSVESWVDADGRVLRAASPLGFSMEKTEYELARQDQEESRGRTAAALDEDVILATAIQSNVDLGEATAWEELRFVLSGVELTGFDLEGGRQELRGDTLVVRREDWEALEAGYTLPYPRMDLREALEPEPLIQSADPRIVRAAATVTSRSAYWRQDPKRVARELSYHVARYVEDAVTFSVPSALQVLDTRRGDCNEHTVLYVAMARALGLPARTAVGLVYVDGSFFYHAWPEVWLDGRWVAVDPTFDQAPADAAHIRFVVGGLAQQVEIVRLIGRLDIEVVGAVGGGGA
ncbi:MAG: transglutaminase-like domain-containing protein [Longimicrobiales bacterium]|nr:transglutaminase-like domain-containing protein [Longimicrobiales bacterium]